MQKLTSQAKGKGGQSRGGYNRDYGGRDYGGRDYGSRYYKADYNRSQYDDRDREYHSQRRGKSTRIAGDCASGRDDLHLVVLDKEHGRQGSKV